MLHNYLQTVPLSIQERAEHLKSSFAVRELLDDRASEFVLSRWITGGPRRMVRDIGERAKQYVHSGRFYQTDQRIAEGDMIGGNPFFIREVLSYQVVDPYFGSVWTADIGSRLRMVLLDGTVIEGEVDARPVVQPVDYLYYNSQTLIENEVWVYVITLGKLGYVAGTMESFPYSSLDLIAVEGDERHLYAVFDREGARPSAESPGNWRDLMYYLIGMAGNPGPPSDLPEKDGAARIAADRLATGTLASLHLLGRFADEAPSYLPPDPVVVGPGDLGVALASPANLHIYDRRGRHVGPGAAGSADVDIRGARYFTNPETGQQFIVIPHADLGEEYVVQVEGTGSGTFDLDLFYTDRQRKQAVRLSYNEVPLNLDTRAELAVEVDDSHVLRVDDDGSGTFDQEQLPSRTIAVPIVELGKARGAPGLVIIGTLLFACGMVGTWLVVRRRRPKWRPFSTSSAPPLPTCVRCGTVAQRSGAQFCRCCGGRLTTAAAQALPVCARCGTIAQRPDAGFCLRCGVALPQIAPSAKPQWQEWLVTCLSAGLVKLCFLLPWIEYDGLVGTGLSLPQHFATLDFTGTGPGVPVQLVFVAPAWAVFVLLTMIWRRRHRRAVAVVHIVGGIVVLGFLAWALLWSGALPYACAGLWGTLLGLGGVVGGGIVACARKE